MFDGESKKSWVKKSRNSSSLFPFNEDALTKSTESVRIDRSPRVAEVTKAIVLTGIFWQLSV